MLATSTRSVLGWLGRANYLAVWIGALILVLALAMPKRDGVNSCIYRVALGLGLTYAQNCDSVHIARDARSIERYLMEASPSRTRPVHILSVAALTHVLSPLLVPMASLLQPLRAWPADLLPFYLAGVVFNVGVLVLSFAALRRLLGGNDDPLEKAALAGLLVSYDLMLAWFWIPHQIPMNVLAPLGGALAFVTGMRALHMPARTHVLFGFATSMACLTYGYCLIWPVAYVAGAVFGAAMVRRAEPMQLSRVLGPYAISVCAPISIWFGGYALAGREFAYEAQSFGQFAWAGEALRSGDLTGEAVRRAWRMTALVAGYLGVWGWFVLACATLLGLAVRFRQPTTRLLSDPTIAGCAVAAVLMLGFNYLQGYHQARLLLFPLLLAQVGVLRLLILARVGAAVPACALAIAAVQLVLGFSAPPVSME